MPDTIWPNGAKPWRSSAAILSEIDERLRRAGVGARRGKGDGAAPVALLDRIVLDPRIVPYGETFGSPLTPNCTMKPETTRKKRCIVVKTVLDQIVEAVGAVGRPDRDAPRSRRAPLLVSNCTL